MPLTEQIALLSRWEFWGLTLLSATASLVSLFLLVHYLRRIRTIEDTATARVRSAHQGYVELVGSAIGMEGEPILGPLSGQECCWYSYKIEKRGDKHWRTLEKGDSEHLFLLRDTTGDCVIDPDGAEVTPGHTDVWYGNSDRPSTYSANPHIDSGMLWKLAGLLGRETTFGSRYRYTESRIHHQDPLYGIGQFKTVDEMDHLQQRHEITRELLHHWKQDRAELLLRFDRNRDGHINPEEWEHARQEAATQAQAEQQQLIAGSTLHIMSDTHDRHTPFLLSTIAEFDLVRRYRRLVYLATSVFFAGGALAVWLLSLRVTT